MDNPVVKLWKDTQTNQKNMTMYQVHRTYSPVISSSDVLTASITLKVTKNVRSICSVGCQDKRGLRFIACGTRGCRKLRDFSLPWPQILFSSSWKMIVLTWLVSDYKYRLEQGNLKQHFLKDKASKVGHKKESLQSH